ncbi:MAG: amidohydrolase family protein [Gloeobacteraceae cyanobacterium ES-bin-316]|nr:amidohydrolase family protein [Ferruginibacter sp.]
MYRKFKPTTIFTGSKMLSEGHVLILTDEGLVHDIVPELQAGADLQLLDGVLSPGFINAHCHIELSHMKGVIPMHTGLVEFVKQVITKREGAGSPVVSGSLSEEIYEQRLDHKLNAMTSAVEELFNGGTVAVGDICNTADSVELKKNSRLHWHNFIEVSGFVDAVAEKRLQSCKATLAAFVKNQPLSGNSLCPHAAYSVSKTLFQLLNEQTGDQIVSIHNQETLAENELYRFKTGGFLNLYSELGIQIGGFAGTGKTSLQSWLPYFNRGQKIISVHNTFTSTEDILFAKTESAGTELSFCICINANLYIENSLPPLEMLIKNNCSIVLGTDSYASNSQLNMMDEINSIQKHFPAISLETILKWATINGAKALGLDNRFGTFEKGKKPGLVLIDVEKGLSKRVA